VDTACRHKPPRANRPCSTRLATTPATTACAPAPSSPPEGSAARRSARAAWPRAATARATPARPARRRSRSRARSTRRARRRPRQPARPAIESMPAIESVPVPWRTPAASGRAEARTPPDSMSAATPTSVTPAGTAGTRPLVEHLCLVDEPWILGYVFASQARRAREEREGVLRGPRSGARRLPSAEGLDTGGVNRVPS
jgi:hypothetical protein